MVGFLVASSGVGGVWGVIVPGAMGVVRFSRLGGSRFR